MYKNKKIFLFFLLFLIFGSLSLAPEALAQDRLNYTLLESIPGLTGLSSDLPTYLQAIYRIALIVVTLSAVLMLSIGGFMYLTSAGNTSSMGTAKTIITDSLIGLVIALCAWLVLYVINPDLTRISISTLSPIGAPPAPSPGVPAPPVAIGVPPTGDAVSLAQQILSNGNITVAGSGDCSSPTGAVTPRRNLTETAAGGMVASCAADCESRGNNGCADGAVRLDERMLRAIQQVGQAYRFTITSLAGGAHGPNSAHYRGRGIDLQVADRAQMQAILAAFMSTGARFGMCEGRSGGNVGCAANGPADHIHVDW